MHLVQLYLCAMDFKVLPKLSALHAPQRHMRLVTLHVLLHGVDVMQSSLVAPSLPQLSQQLLVLST